MNLKDLFTTSAWWGKFLGACFGYLIAGPIGALLGILIGNFFDKGMRVYFTDPYFSYHSIQHPYIQKVFLEATFSVLGYVAKSDGRVSEQEIKTAKLLMFEMRLNREKKRLAQLFFTEGKQREFKLDKALTQLHEACINYPELLKLFVEIQYQTAQADGLNTKKIQALDIIFARLGFAPLHQQYRFFEDFNYTAYQNYQDNRNRDYYQSRSSSSQDPFNAKGNLNSLDQAYALLEVSPQATQKEIKQAYRRLVSRNHPDKLMAQGLSADQIKLANDKTQKITKAYDLICKSKGW